MPNFNTTKILGDLTVTGKSNLATDSTVDGNDILHTGNFDPLDYPEFVGPQGDPGEDGADGSDGAAATIAVGTTTTLSAGSNATVSNSGTSSAATFNFGIPRGADGTDGSDGDDLGFNWSGTSLGVNVNGGAYTYVDLKGETGAPGTDGTDGTNGADGLGWTGGSYNASTGIVTFSSDDGLGFTTGDLRGADGTDGTNGTNGTDGADGTSYYVHIRWGDSTTPSTLYTTPTGHYYIGVYSGTSSSAPSTYSSYTWAYYRGPAGADGADGVDGSDATVTKAAVEAVLTGEISTHTHSYLPLSGGTMTGSITMTDSGDPIYVNRIGGRGTEIYIGAGESLGSISGGAEQVYIAGESGVSVHASSDNLTSGLNRSAQLIDTAGNASWGSGSITAGTFIGDLSGNATSATNAGWADQVDVNTSTSTSTYNLLWHSGDTVYGSNGKLTIQPSTGNFTTQGRIYMTSNAYMEYNATDDAIDIVFV